MIEKKKTLQTSITVNNAYDARARLCYTRLSGYLACGTMHLWLVFLT